MKKKFQEMEEESVSECQWHRGGLFAPTMPLPFIRF